ncbi:CEL lipase, partial [Pteruthius melanotis]|nr:CEL lipase [Pteruthius melanotis]
GTLKAKDFKKRCMQMTLTQTDVRGSEDCLYLNIWIPQGRRQVSTKLPVMVYIYGGAFLVGGSQGANFLDNYLYDGEEIAVRGNVIVVTDVSLSLLLQLGEKLGCPTDNTTILADCLRSSDPKELTLAYHLQLTNLPMPLVHTLALAPVVDGDFLPDAPEKLFANAADIDYLAGVNDMDGHIFAGVDLPAINRPLVKVTADQVYDLIKGLTVDRGEAGANATYNIYTQSWGDKPSQEVVKKTVVELITDYIFLIPTQLALNLHLQNAQSGKTYSYLFSQPSRMPIYPSWVGADHADDLQYVFGKPFATPLGYLPKHRTVSKAMIAYWTNFARTGDPNKGHSDVPVSWPAYDNKGKYYLDINNKMNKKSVKQDLRSRFVTFWNSVYLQLPQVAN